MSLLLCRQESVKHPYYVEFLGIHLYTSQELCYVIYQHPLLVLEGFVGEPLLTFLREELNQGFLALKLERWLKSSENRDETLVMILQECDYYTSAEISRYKQQLMVIRKLHLAEFGKQKADALFHLRQYGRALVLYQELVDYPTDDAVQAALAGSAYHNIGACYARMFQLERAFEAYEKAYGKTNDLQDLECLYQLTLVDVRLSLSDRCSSMITEELQTAWSEKMETAKTRAKESEPVQQLEDLFSKDSIKRHAGATKLVSKWKQEYRSMV